MSTRLFKNVWNLSADYFRVQWAFLFVHMRNQATQTLRFSVRKESS